MREKISMVEKILSIQERSVNVGQKHTFQPAYIFPLFSIPVGVANRIEKLQRDFLLGGLDNEFKFHLVNWKKGFTPLNLGGLRIRSLLTFNQAM